MRRIRTSQAIFAFAAILIFFQAQQAASAAPLFLNLPRYSAGATLQYFQQADVNGDGKPDIVGLASGVTVMLGNGVGGYGPPKITSVSGFDKLVFTSLAIADFNGDGRPDIAFLGLYHVTGSMALAVMLGNGDGSFQSPVVTILGGASATSTAVGDFNGDGKLDVAVGVTVNTIGQVLILEGEGNGRFSAPVTTVLSTEVNCIAAGDFNNDGKADVVVQQNYQGIHQTYGWVLLGKDNGTFQTPIALDIYGACAPGILVGDLNRDGNQDLVMDYGIGGISVAYGDGTGHFVNDSIFVCDEGYEAGQCAVALGDFNGDGYPDIAAFDRIAFTVSILLNEKIDGSFTNPTTYQADGVSTGTGFISGAPTAGGKQDLVFSNNAQGVSVLVGNGNGTFQGNVAQLIGLTAGRTGFDLRVYDFNGDHKPDLITVPSNNVLLNNGNGYFIPRGLAAGCTFTSFAIGDFNGDGKVDIAGAQAPLGGPMAICKGNGDGTFTYLGQIEQGIEHQFVLPGDFNNDGKLDFAVSDEGGISVFLGNGDGTFQAEIPTALSATYPATALGDFNNDGKLDIAAITPSGIAVLLGNGDGTFKAPIISAGPTTGLLTAVDLNKDGKLDLVSSGISVLLGKGNGTFQVPVHYPGGSTRPIVADFNGDGHLDVAVGSTTSINVLLGDGTGKLGAPTVYNAAPLSGIAFADFNGDKANDLAAALSPTGAQVISILLNQK